MEALETQLWDFIDGVMDPRDAEYLHQRILIEPETAQLYQKLMALSIQLKAIENDEPSMSFSRNVMDKIATELPPVKMKTQIDHRIIFAVTALFIVSLITMFAFTLENASFQTYFSIPNIKMIDFSSMPTGIAMKVFLFINIVLALICLDTLFRQKLRATKKRPTN